MINSILKNLYGNYIGWKNTIPCRRVSFIELIRRIYFRKNCGKCRYFSYEKDNLHGLGKIGYCVRFPPAIHDINDELAL